jgi:hypothetical protein
MLLWSIVPKLSVLFYLSFCTIGVRVIGTVYTGDAATYFLALLLRNCLYSTLIELPAEGDVLAFVLGKDVETGNFRLMRAAVRFTLRGTQFVRVACILGGGGENKFDSFSLLKYADFSYGLNGVQAADCMWRGRSGCSLSMDVRWVLEKCLWRIWRSL